MNINLNLEENKILINTNKEYYNITIEIYDWNPYHETEYLIYINSTNILKNLIYWFSPAYSMIDLYGISIKIKHNDETIKIEKFRIKTIHGLKIKQQVLVLWTSTGLGDNLFCTPIIRKLYEIYNQKIILYTYFPEVFSNNPYIKEMYKISDDITWCNTSELNIDINTHEIHNVGHSYLKPYNVLNKNNPDMINLLAHEIALNLSENEKRIDFFPDECELPKLPDYYIVLNTNQTHGPRTWGEENYNKLISLLESQGIYVVILGKDMDYETKYSLKNIKVSYGLNLINQTTLSQAWHIINNSIGFVSHTSGLFQLAMSTNTKIFELGSNMAFSTWVTRENKNIYIEGKCKLHCYSNDWCCVSEHGTINQYMPTYQCHLGFEKYECHPTPERVFDEIKKAIFPDIRYLK